MIEKQKNIPLPYPLPPPRLIGGRGR